MVTIFNYYGILSYNVALKYHGSLKKLWYFTMVLLCESEPLMRMTQLVLSNV